MRSSNRFVRRARIINAQVSVVTFAVAFVTRHVPFAGVMPGSSGFEQECLEPALGDAVARCACDDRSIRWPNLVCDRELALLPRCRPSAGRAATAQPPML